MIGFAFLAYHMSKTKSGKLDIKRRPSGICTRGGAISRYLDAENGAAGREARTAKSNGVGVPQVGKPDQRVAATVVFD